MRLVLLVVGLCLLGAPGAAPDELVRVDTSALMGSPDPLPLFEAEVAFPHLSFEFPVDLTHAGDGTNRLLVASQDGRIYVFENRREVREKKVFLDMSHLVAREFFEQGLLAIAFHPRYRQNGQLFVYYSVVPLGTRVSRFQVSGDDPDRADPDSEERLLEIPQPFWNHNSGSLRFGPDGYLYVGVGDGGSAEDPQGNGQNPRTLLGTILRIDVDRQDPPKAYGIPADNPFVDLGERARPEIWALGLRNPWKMCFDRETGALWVADVGQDLWEEVNVIVRGGNYGWKAREGKHPFDGDATKFSDDFVDPVWEYHHTEGQSITGGVVYRGSRLPEISGWYVCADWLTGNVWGLRTRDGKLEESRKIMPPLHGISAFGEDEAGEIYFTAFDEIAPVRFYDTVDGRIYRFRRAPDLGASRETFPRKLSGTGLFKSVKDHTLVRGLIPYDVNVPLWSDGAGKDRYLALPGTAGVRFSEDGNWEFPVGTVMVKTFSLETVRGKADSRRRLETRLMVHSPRGWAGYTYLWNEEQTEAHLLDGFLEKTYSVETPEGKIDQTWHFPSRTECMTCHSGIKGHVLGVNTSQMNRPCPDGAGKENQLRQLERLGAFAEDLPSDPFALEAYPDWDDATASSETLARAYLDVNCAFCHAPGGAGMAPIDLRYHTPLRHSRLLPDDRKAATAAGEPPPVAPGNPAGSKIIDRMLTRRSDRLPGGPRLPRSPMPPLSTHLPDERAVEVIRSWIAELHRE